MTRPASSLTSTLELLQCSLHHGFWLLTARGLLSLCVRAVVLWPPWSPCDCVSWLRGSPLWSGCAVTGRCAFSRHTVTGVTQTDRWTLGSRQVGVKWQHTIQSSWEGQRNVTHKAGKKVSLFIFLRYTVYTDYYLQLSEEKYRIQRCYSGNQLIGWKLLSLH